jgi:outer membrane receptor for ferrienterochelin and colicins
MRYQILLTFSLAILFSESLIGQVAYKNFKVVVTDSGTAAPLPFATVCWQSLSDKASGNGVANANGEVMIKSQGGRVVVTVSCLGYRPLHDTVVLSSPIVLSLSEDIFNLEQVTVTGTRTPRTIKESAVFTQLITQRDIRLCAASTIKDVIEMQIPSVEMNQHGYGAALTSQGLDGKYTLVLIDGERMAGESDGNVDFSRINAANIERVEIVRGASSALYGSNALGGVINIITKKPQKRWDISVGMRYAQPNSRDNTSDKIASTEDLYLRRYYRNQDRANLNSDITLGFKSDNFYSNTYLGYKSEDAYQLFNRRGETKYYPALDSLVNVAVSAIPFTVNGLMDYTISNKSGFTHNRWSAEVRGSYYNHEEFDFSRDGNHNLYKDYSIGGHAERKFEEGSTLRLSVNHDVYGKYNALEKTNSSTNNYENAIDAGKLTFTAKYREKHQLLVGVELLREDLKSVMYKSGKFISHGVSDVVVVLQDEVAVMPRVSLVASLRSGYHSEYKASLAPAATIKYDAGFWKYRVTYARGFRSPSLKELYSRWDHQGMFWIIGSTSLKPEKSNFGSFSVDYVNTERKLNVTGIASYSHIFDKISGYWTNNQREYHYANIEVLRIASAELLLKWKVSGAIQLKSGYVYTTIIGNKEEERRLASSPHGLTTQAEYSLRHGMYEMVATLSGKFIGAKHLSELDDSNNQFYNVSYPAYYIWNLTVNNRIGEHLTLTVGVKNLFNYTAPVVTFNTSTSVGRRMFVTATYNF